jgi:hypothetical protein
MTGTVAFDEGAFSTDCKVSDVGAGGPVGSGDSGRGSSVGRGAMQATHGATVCRVGLSVVLISALQNLRL